MRNKVKVKPASEGLLVRDPVTKKPLPAEGATVQMSNYWQRRLNYGDVVTVEGGDEPSPHKPETPDDEAPDVPDDDSPTPPPNDEVPPMPNDNVKPTPDDAV